MDLQNETHNQGEWIILRSKTRQGKRYYFNTKTKESVWNRPAGCSLETQIEGRPPASKRKLSLSSSDEANTDSASNISNDQLLGNRCHKQIHSTSSSHGLPSKSQNTAKSHINCNSQLENGKQDGGVGARVVPEQPTSTYHGGSESSRDCVAPQLETSHSIYLPDDRNNNLSNAGQGNNKRKRNKGKKKKKKPVPEPVHPHSETCDVTVSSTKNSRKVLKEVHAAEKVSSNKSLSSTKKRNLAEMRLEKLRACSQLKKVRNEAQNTSASSCSVARPQKVLPHKSQQETVPESESSSLEVKCTPRKCTTLVKSNVAEERLLNLQLKLNSEKKQSSTHVPSQKHSTLESPNNLSSFGAPEAMEIEYMESEVLNDIEELRLKDHVFEALYEQSFMDVDMDTSTDQRDICSAIYIVLDTNILLSHLNFVERLRDTILPEKGAVHLYLPWQVLQELDHLKEKGKSSIRTLARRAINYLYANFSSKHPRVHGEKFLTDSKTSSTCPDDIILQSCLQLKQQGVNLILLSNDVNLLNKALVCDLVAFNKNELEKQLQKNTEVADGVTSVSKPSNQNSNKSANLLCQYDLILCETKSIILKILTEVVSKGMEDEYKHLWKKRTIFPPPWEVDQVIQCLSQHWFAICGKFTPPQVLKVVETLKNFLRVKAKSYGLTAADLKLILGHVRFLFESIPLKYVDILAPGLRKIQELEMKLDSGVTSVVDDSGPSEVCDLESRNRLVFTCFEEAYNAAQNLCNCSSYPSIDSEWFKKARCMLDAVQALVRLLNLLLSGSGSVNEDNPLVMEIVSLIKGSHNITPLDFVNFFKQDCNRVLLENGMQQFMYFEGQLMGMVQQNL